mgnify:CR=1 FL=1|jgi:hypothetical protein|tara:strand:- start:2078 stop:2290 length:213 start_codon:yes stop_codon:yes gene_type:complete
MAFGVNKSVWISMDEIKISPKGTNITGMYRKCQKLDGTCNTLVSCPYTHCSEHWIAKAFSGNSLMKEVLG